MKIMVRMMHIPVAWVFPLCCAWLGACSESGKDNPADWKNAELAGDQPVVARMMGIIIPKVNLVDATPEEAFDFLRHALMTHDPETEPGMRGVSMIIRGPKTRGESVLNDDAPLGHAKLPTRIQWTAEHVPFFELVEEVARQSGKDAYLTSAGFLFVPEGTRPFATSESDEVEVWHIIRESPAP